MLNELNPRRAAFIIVVAALATILGAWIFQYLGYPPCPLCLEQRWAYYIAIPLALITGLLAGHNAAAAKGLLYLLALIWLGSMIFGIYHSGVEWKWWPGPDTCGGEVSGGLPDLSGPVIRCDEAAIRIFGLSLAGWNAIISLGLVIVAFIGARRQGSSSVSQYR
jgi:disulfide bond formation protein DsbB